MCSANLMQETNQNRFVIFWVHQIRCKCKALHLLEHFSPVLFFPCQEFLVLTHEILKYTFKIEIYIFR